MTDRVHRADTHPAAPSQLSQMCELARWSHGAAAVSVAVITDDGLEYVASSGAGAVEIVGTRLGAGEGLAGFVAASGQSLAVRDAVGDPRFARAVAEGTGYVPDAIQITPIVDADGDVAGVMSMLDRGHHDDTPADPPIALAGFADLVASLLPRPLPAQDVTAELTRRLDNLGDDDRAAVVTAMSSVIDAVQR